MEILSCVRQAQYPALESLTITTFKEALVFLPVDQTHACPQLAKLKACDTVWYLEDLKAFRRVHTLDVIGPGAWTLEDVTFTLPILRHAALRDYWIRGIDRIPVKYDVIEGHYAKSSSPEIMISHVRHVHLALRAIDSSSIYRYLRFSGLSSLHLFGSTVLHPCQPVVAFVAGLRESLVSLTFAMQSSREHNERAKELIDVCPNVSRLFLYGVTESQRQSKALRRSFDA